MRGSWHIEGSSQHVKLELGNLTVQQGAAVTQIARDMGVGRGQPSRQGREVRARLVRVLGKGHAFGIDALLRKRFLRPWLIVHSNARSTQSL